MAEYGLAALVAGRVAAKLGLFAKLISILLAMKKLAIVMLIGAAALFKKFFGKLTGKTKDTTPVA
ncbi:MAG TPA: DUF2167 domain-containing protein [Nitrospiria bacterium]|nr:DUF2167 domain-containing protein [Nitrospiria bacterium]